MRKTVIISILLYLVVEVSYANRVYSNYNNYKSDIDNHIESEEDYTPTLLNKENKNFKTNRVLAGFDLVLTNNGTTSTTKILYHATCTEGLDVGWDAGAFEGGTQSFALYTHLACDSSGINFSLQVLSDNYNDKTVIPLSVYTPANSTIRFSTNLNTGGFPTDRDIYIEDRETNTVQKISDSETYQVTVTDKLSGIGRFYLHTSKFVWLGTTNTDWDTASNWSTVSVPTTTDDILIANVVNKPIASGAVVVNKMAISAGSSLTVGGNLTINDMLTINSDIDLFGSLIVNGNSTGNITYNRYVTFNATGSLGWHLVGSPVVSENIEDIITNGSLADGSGGNRKGLAIYNNNQTQAPFGSWVYQTTSSTGAMNSGNGYSIKRNVAGKIPFTGTLKTDNLSSFSITVGSQNAWNLIANPYPSSIIGVGSANSFLSENLNQLDPNAAAIYVWDSKAQDGTGEYKIINNISSATNITPAQGFFVAAKSGGGSINITEAMQTHGLTDLFLRNNNLFPHIKLNISDGNKIKSTDIKYSRNATKGLDLGYDAKTFDAVSNLDFGIYTHLVSDNQGVNFTLQALPDNKYEGTIIPIGVNALSGTKISFSANLMNIPEELHVFLEDRYNNTFTELDDASVSYSVSLDSDYRGIGRFYLHTTKQETFNENSTNLEYVTMYKTKNNTLKIIGLKDSNITVSIFNTLAKQVLQSSFLLNDVQEIPLNNLEAGVYIVHLQTDYGKLHKKIILE